MKADGVDVEVLVVDPPDADVVRVVDVVPPVALLAVVHLEVPLARTVSTSRIAPLSPPSALKGCVQPTSDYGRAFSWSVSQLALAASLSFLSLRRSSCDSTVNSSPYSI